MEHTLEENVLTHFGGNEKNSLIHILNDDQELDDDFPMFKHSRYYTQDTFLDHNNLQNGCFSILSLNIHLILMKMQIYPYFNLKIIHVFLKVNNAVLMEV